MHEWTLGRAAWIQHKSDFTGTAKKEKRGVPRHHENMLPGNSFPQICVVSVNNSVGNGQYCTRVLKDYVFK
jgi:hypothetical protein